MKLPPVWAFAIVVLLLIVAAQALLLSQLALRVESLSTREQSDNASLSQRISLLASGTQGQLDNQSLSIQVLTERILHVSGLGNCALIDPGQLKEIDYLKFYVLVTFVLTPSGGLNLPLVCPTGR